jgi:hypothetical protein
MNRSHESTPRMTYTEDELAGLLATYFGDKLTQTQLDSLVATVAAAHVDRRNRAAGVWKLMECVVRASESNWP